MMNIEIEKKILPLIRDVPDFPKPGILFKDITPLLQDAVAFQYVIKTMQAAIGGSAPDLIAGIESRGFIFGATLAHAMNLGFIPLRKPGKLPYKTVKATYQLEYGSDAIEMHTDAVRPGQKIVVVDDLLATGGTAGAACCLLRDAGAIVVACHFLIELDFLQGRDKLEVAGFHKIESLMHF